MLVEVSKLCRHCRQDLPLDAFFRNSKGRYGRHSVCRDCSSRYDRNKRERILLLGDARIPKFRLCGMCGHTLPARSFSKSASSRNGLRTYCRECDKIVRRSGKYGLGRDRVAHMLRQTKCDACSAPFPTDSDKFFDHRHSDGAVRGVLCERCNTTLGKCDENPSVLLAICDYIARTMGVDYRFQPYSVTEINEPDISQVGAPRALTPEEKATCPTNQSSP